MIGDKDRDRGVGINRDDRETSVMLSGIAGVAEGVQRDDRMQG